MPNRILSRNENFKEAIEGRLKLLGNSTLLQAFVVIRQQDMG